MQECHPTNFYDHTGARRSENSKISHCLKFVVRWNVGLGSHSSLQPLEDLHARAARIVYRLPKKCQLKKELLKLDGSH